MRHPPDMPDTNAAAAPRPSRWRRAVRALLVPYWLLLGVGGVLLILFVGYGLAHGSSGTTLAFLAATLVGLAALAAAPLLLLASGGVVLRVGQGVAGLVMLAAMGGVALLWWEVHGAGVWQARRLEAALADVAVVEASHRPLQVAGTTIGLELSATVKLPRTLPPDRHAAALVQALSALALGGPDHRNGGPFGSRLNAGRVTVDGRPIDSLTGVPELRLLHRDAGDERLATALASRMPAGAGLPAGSYRVVTRQWFAGLRDRAENDADPCVDNDPWRDPDQAARLRAMSGQALNAWLRVSLPLGGRRGHHTLVRSLPVPPGYDDAAWRAQWKALSLPRCADIDAEAERTRAAAELAQKQRQAQAAGDRHKLWDQICLGDAAGLRERIAAEAPDGQPWKTAHDLNSIANGCGSPLSPEVVAMVARPLMAQSMDGWCRLLGGLHRGHRVDALRALVNEGVPLDCGGEGRWRMGLPSPTVGAPAQEGPSRDPASVARWLSLLRDAGVDLCARLSGDPTKTGLQMSYLAGERLIDMAVRAYPAEVVAVVVDARCPALAPPDPFLGGPHRWSREVSAALVWTLRRHEVDSLMALPAADEAVLARLDSALLPTGDELNRLHAASGRSLMHELAASIQSARNPRLLRVLADAGARLDAADAKGQSWFDAGTGTLPDPVAPWVEALAQLTPAQRRQLHNPVVLASGAPGRPVALLQPRLNGGRNPLNTALCERGLVSCTADR